MSLTDTAQTLHDVGYRRAILALGAFWGAAPALTFGMKSLTPLSPDGSLLALGTVTTLTLGALYELDSRTLAERGRGVPMAWSYALVAPISVVAWAVPAPVVPVLAYVGVLAGPPASALCYCWQRGRTASVE